MKRTIALLLTLVMIVGMLPTVALASDIVTNPEASNLPQSDGNTLRLWYDEPVGSFKWENRALPLGNGHTGGLTYGEIVNERLHVNEKTLWGGRPISDPHSLDDYEFDYEALEAQRQQMDDHSSSVFPVGLGSPYGMGNKSDASMGQYQDLGDIYFDFSAAGLTTDVTNYVRDLDLRTAVSSVNFDHNGVHYEREFLASFPDDVMASHFTASEGGKISFTASLSTSSSGLRATAAADGALMHMTGSLSASGEKWLFMAGVTAVGGTVTANEDGTITVTGADEATVYVHTATDYLPVYPEYTDGRDFDTMIADAKAVVNAAMDKGYTAVREAHVADHDALFSRVEIDLGGTCPDVTTDVLMANYRNGEYNHAVEEMAFQMGRYMTIAASREGDELPTNLCGIWLVGGAGSYWGADFHFNVNVQMNYWPSYTTNLAECGFVFNEFVESLVIPGRLTAAACNGVKTEDYMNTPLGDGNGFMINTQINSWGHTWPIGSQEYGWNIGGSSWAMQNVYDYYKFTGDTKALETSIYPMLKEMAKFWDNYLWWSDYQNRWVVGPSVSAEQGPTVNGTAYDQSIVWELYDMAIEASELLGVDEDLRAGWKVKQEGLNPIIIGEEGQVKEWYEESKTGYGQVEDLEEVRIPNFGAGGSANNGSLHRHTSQLIGLFPGTLINQDTEEWMDAAIVTLEKRNLNGTGWSRAHKLNMYARTGLSEESYELVKRTCAGNSNGLLDNLFGSHPPYQIDCNFGLTAGIAEMLIQSQAGYTQFLPTLPDEWATGSVTGLVARGNFVVDMAWTEGQADKFTVTSRNGGTFTGEYKDLAGYTVKDSQGNTVATTALTADRVSFETVAGETYTINFEGADQLSVQKTVATVLAGSMTDTRLAAAKANLLAVVETATDAETLANAAAAASAAMKFLSVIDEAQAFYDEKAPQAAESAQATTAIEQLADKIAEANALVSDAAATADSFAAKKAELAAAQDNVTGILTVYQTYVGKLDEAKAYYAEKAELGTVWISAKTILDELAANLEAGEALLANAAASADDFNAAMNAFGDSVSEMEALISSIFITMDTTDGILTMTASDVQFEIRYTIDGNEVNVYAPLYEEPVQLPGGTYTIQAALFLGDTQMSNVFTTSMTGINLALNKAASSPDPDWNDFFGGAIANYLPQYAVDGKLNTSWSPRSSTPTFNLNLGEVKELCKVIVRFDGQYGMRTQAFNIQVSENGTDYVTVYATNKAQANHVCDFETVKAQYVRMKITAGNGEANVNEFEVFGMEQVGEPVDFTELLEIIAEAKTMQQGEAYANGSAEDKANLDNARNAAEKIAANAASHISTVEAIRNALIEAMGPFGGVSAEKALAMLNEQLDAAKALAAELPEGTTLQLLNAAIAAAEQVKTDAKADQYQASAMALKNAVARANEAAAVETALVPAKNIYDQYASQTGAWIAAQNAVAKLEGAIHVVEAALADPDADKQEMKAGLSAALAAAEEAEALFASVKLTMTLSDGAVVLTPSDEQFEIRYTLDGNKPSVISKLYTAPVTLPDRALTFQAQMFLGEEMYGAPVLYTVSDSNVALGKTASSPDADWGAEYRPGFALDGNMNTRWAPRVNLAQMTIDLGKVHTINGGAVYETAYTGRVEAFDILVATDANGPWTKVCAGAAVGKFSFDAVDAQYVRYVTTASNGQPNIGEIEIYAVPEQSEAADFTALNEALVVAESVKNGSYLAADEAARANFDLYYNIAAEVAANANSEQETVDAAVKALNEAIATLTVVMKVSGTDVIVDDETVTYTVSVSNTNGFATATLKMALTGKAAAPVFEGLNGWQIIAQTVEGEQMEVVLFNAKGLTSKEDVDILSVTAETIGEVGDATLTVTDARLSAYVGDMDETYVSVDLSAAKADVLVDYSIYDVNRDGIVDQLDLTRCQRYYGMAAGGAIWSDLADVNDDGLVNIIDMILIMNHYSK